MGRIRLIIDLDPDIDHDVVGWTVKQIIDTLKVASPASTPLLIQWLPDDPGDDRRRA